MKHRKWSIVLGVFVLAALACGPCGMIGNLTGDGEEIEAPGAPGEPVGEEPLPPSGADGGVPQIAGLDTLNSYRVRQVFKVEAKDGSESDEMVVLEEWVREPPAQHVVIDGPDEGFDVEMVYIGDKAWVKMGGTWVETTSEGAEGMNFVSDLDITPDVGSDMRLAGRERVNGVDCKHYTFDSENFAITDPTEGAMTMHLQGDVWIADQGGLPSIVVRERIQYDGYFMPIPGASTSSAVDVVTYFERDVTDINKPIDIRPPEQ